MWYYLNVFPNPKRSKKCIKSEVTQTTKEEQHGLYSAAKYDT